MKIDFILRDKIKIYILMIILPIFIYINNDQFSFNSCMGTERCIAFNPGSIFLILTLPYFLLMNKIYFLFALILLFLFTIEYFLLLDVTLIFKSLKSLLPFLFLLSYYLISIKLKIKKNSVRYYLEKFIPYTIVFFQIIIILSTPNLFENRSGILFLEDERDRWANFFIDYFKVYNYNQYFSFILVMVAGVRIFSSSKNLEILFFAVIMFYGCIDAKNYTAILCGLTIIIFKLSYLTLSKFKNKKIIIKTCCYLIISIFFLLPIFSYLIIEILSSYPANDKQILTFFSRLYRWDFIFSNMEIINILSGIYPNPYYLHQPHNQFLEYFLYFGLVKATILTSIIYLMIRRISEIKFLIPLSVVIGLGGAMTEILSHLYTSQIIFMYIIFAASIDKRKIF